MRNSEITKMQALYKIGDKAPEHGMYMCVPCGYVQEFFKDEPFTTCELCFAGTDQAPEGYTDSEVEFWELLV